MSLLNVGARVPVCGLIALYNATALPTGPDLSGALMRAILRAAFYELRSRPDVPARVVVTEYVDVAAAFFGPTSGTPGTLSTASTTSD